ncbi:hypothetical protein Tco_0065780 [Tanacetum coccineum]
MKSKRCRQNTRHRRRPHEREKGRNVRGRRTLEERKVNKRVCNKRINKDVLQMGSISKGLVVRVFVEEEARITRAAGVNLKGFFEVRFIEVLAMKNTSKVLKFLSCRGYRHGLSKAFKVVGFQFIKDQQSKSQYEHIDEFHNIVGDLAAIDTTISNVDQALLLLTSLPSSYNNFVETLIYSRETLKLEYVLATLNSRELQKMKEAKGDGDQVSGSGADEYDSVDVMMAMSVEELLDWIMDSGGSYHITYRRDYLVDFEEYDGGNILLGDGRECRRAFTMKMQSGKIKVIRGSLVVLSGTRRANCIYTMDGQPMTRKTLKGRKQLGEYHSLVCLRSFWAEDTTMSTYLVDGSPSSVIRFKAPVDMLGFFGWLASIMQRMLKPVKVKCIFLGYHEGIVGNKLWRLDDLTSNVVLYRNMGFNESGGYKKTFIGSGVGAGSQKVQSQDFIYYHLAHDREQHSARELFRYREDSNEAAFVVAAVEKIYAHESLTFNVTVAYEVISKWNAGLKEDMNARSDVYVLSNGCKKSSDDRNDYYWEYAPGDYDVEKNGKWSCIYVVESLQVYHEVYTRPNIASVDVGYLAKRLAIESGFELKIVVGIATGALSKAIPGSRFQHRNIMISSDSIISSESSSSSKSNSSSKSSSFESSSSEDIVSSKGPSKELLKWYDDTKDEDILEFMFSKSEENVETWDGIVKRSFRVKKPRSCADKENRKRKVKGGS